MYVVLCNDYYLIVHYEQCVRLIRESQSIYMMYKTTESRCYVVQFYACKLRKHKKLGCGLVRKMNDHKQSF